MLIVHSAAHQLHDPPPAMARAGQPGTNTQTSTLRAITSATVTPT